ncbi:MAG: hypothetical protein ABI318_13345 [Chthoniobacteraceae bacterium]
MSVLPNARTSPGDLRRVRFVIENAPRLCAGWAMSEHRDVNFPTTHWTLVSRLRSADADMARRALGELVAQYRYTLYAYIRRRGFGHHDAEDALHDFLLRLLQARALEDAEEERGRLRGFLGVALGRFLQNWRRDAARRGVTGDRSATDAAEETGEDAERYANERFSEEDTPESVFDRKWGHALMARVVERLKSQCAERKKDAIFSALQPVLMSGGSLRGHAAAAIAAKLSMSEGALRVALNRHLCDYRAILEEEVLQTVERREDVPDEIAHLMSVFGAG